MKKILSLLALGNSRTTSYHLNPPHQSLNREKLKAKFGNSTAQVGGKGSVRRNIKASHKSAVVDDKKLQAALKKSTPLSVIPGIEEVTMYKNDGNAIYFSSPKCE